MVVGAAAASERQIRYAAGAPLTVDASEFAKAVWRGDATAVDEMIAAGAHVNAAAPDSQSPLHLAVEQLDVGIARRLIAAGADVDEELEPGWTPLVHAIAGESDAAMQRHQEPGHETTEMTELLLAAGAAVTAAAFEMANRCRHEKAVSLLRKHIARDPS